MRKFIVIMATITAATTVSAQRIQYPKAQKDGTVDHYFGTEVADPYRWLENDTSQQTAAWVEAENRVTKAYLSNSFPAETAQATHRAVELREDYGSPQTAWEMVFL